MGNPSRSGTAPPADWTLRESRNAYFAELAALRRRVSPVPPPVWGEDDPCRSGRTQSTPIKPFVRVGEVPLW